MRKHPYSSAGPHDVGAGPRHSLASQLENSKGAKKAHQQHSKREIFRTVRDNIARSRVEQGSK